MMRDRWRGTCEVSRQGTQEKILRSMQVHGVLKGNVRSDYSPELWFVLPFVVLPSKRKSGFHVDVVASCAESRDQRRGREEMRARGERRRMRKREGGRRDRKGIEKSPFH